MHPSRLLGSQKLRGDMSLHVELLIRLCQSGLTRKVRHIRKPAWRLYSARGFHIRRRQPRSAGRDQLPRLMPIKNVSG